MSNVNRFTYMRYNKVGRTTQLDEETTWFKRNEGGSPRKMIYANECPSELKAFEACMEETGGNLAACSQSNAALEACGGEAFKQINAMEQPYDYKKGLSK